MPLHLDIKRVLSSRSDRVKCVDIHPTNPWVLCALYNGNIYVWDHTNQTLVKTFEISELPVRAARFVPRKNWIITAADDLQIAVFNYNTHEKVTSFESHTDYIRCIAPHPALPVLLSSSDDMVIKLWNWDKNWQNTMVFEGHTHYVMMVAFNPKDSNTFASASLDRTVKVWNLGSPTPNFTLEGHEKGLNCVDYFAGGEKPYLITGSDDKTVKVWDYQTKTCVQTLRGHSHNVANVCFHPNLPIILTGSEDGTVRIWHASTYRLENTLNYGMGRVWGLACQPDSNNVAIGYDEGTIMIKLGREEPAVSMDNTGRIIWARHNEIQTVNVKIAEDVKDGELLQLAPKELGSCEVYPHSLQHNPNGRFVVVCGDGEYIIYTARVWRNKSFGQALEFVWSSDSQEYATRESTSKIKVFHNFKEKSVLKFNFGAEALYGGSLIGVKGAGFIVFFDWESGSVVRKIDVTPTQVYWAESGDFVCIACEASFYILKYNKQAVAEAVESGEEISGEGIEAAFDVVTDISETIKTAHWIGDVLIYTNTLNRLNYCVGVEVVTLAHLDRPMYLLGYIAKENRLYLIDKDTNIVSYSLLKSVLEYQTAILRQEFDAAEAILPSIPNEYRSRIARFLESQGETRLALAVSNDPSHQFDLALSLGELEMALEIAGQEESEARWRQLADLAMKSWKFDMAGECLRKAADLSGLLLLYTARGDKDGMIDLANMAVKQGKNNIAFIAFFLCHRLEDCLDLLVRTGRIPEAAFLARTYLPSHVSRLVGLWRDDLKLVNQKAADSLADPMEYENLFPDLKWALDAEAIFTDARKYVRPATDYPAVAADLDRNLIDELKEGLLQVPEGVEIPTFTRPAPPPVVPEPTDMVAPPASSQEDQYDEGYGGGGGEPDGEAYEEGEDEVPMLADEL